MKKYGCGCTEHNHESGFSCPAELPASAPDTRFCSPNKCQDKIPTKRFSSPNSSLPPEELEQLKKFIEHINDLLRTLSNPRSPNNLTALRLHFIKLRGITAKVVYDCNDNTGSIEGLLKEAGRDFIQIESAGEKHYIPYMRICELQYDSCEEMHLEHESHQELIDIDPCLRREIVLNFGETVIKNPNLINIFFGIPLYLELLKLLDCRIAVKVLGQNDDIVGILIGSAEDKICIKINKLVQEIKIAEICKVTI